MILQAIVFDFDGVLADTEPLHLRAFQQVVQSQGLELGADEYYANYLGFDDAGVFARMAEDRRLPWRSADIQVLLEEKARVFADLAGREPVLFPGVSERLRAWSAVVPIAVASGALAREIELVLSASGLLDSVRAVVAAGDTAAGKPAPDPYLRALQLLQSRAGIDRLDAARTVAVEDSLWGIESARTAGMKVVAVATSYTADKLAGADLVVPSIASLELDVLDALARR
jgi:beta-phosphoglucomutase-like phosphatase (HAD superfamily)